MTSAIGEPDATKCQLAVWIYIWIYGFMVIFWLPNLFSPAVHFEGRSGFFTAHSVICFKDVLSSVCNLIPSNGSGMMATL